MSRMDQYRALMQAGKIKEARALLEAEKADAKYFPDTVAQRPGKPARFTKRGKEVVKGEDGKWRLKEPS